MQPAITSADLNKMILDLKRKNGDRIATAEEERIMTAFIDGTISKTELTKLKKIYAKFVDKVVSMTAKSLLNKKPEELSHNLTYMGAAMYGDITSCTVAHQKHSRLDKDGYCYKERPLKADELKVIEQLMENVSRIERGVVTEIKKFEAGEKDRQKSRKQEAMKGKVNKALYEILLVIRDKWEKVVYDNYMNFLTRQRSQAAEWLQDEPNLPFTRDRKDNRREIAGHYRQIGVINYNKITSGAMVDNCKAAFTIVSDDVLKKISARVAKDEADSFLFKMCDKLGAIKFSDNVTAQDAGSSKPFETIIKVTDGDITFRMNNTIVRNTSPLGTMFYQYPCTFIGITIGEQIFTTLSEKEIKEKINAHRTKQ